MHGGANPAVVLAALRARRHPGGMTDAFEHPSRADVAAALLHLARLATAHAGHGIQFVTIDKDKTISEPYLDKESLDALAEATKILLADRVRVRDQAAKLLIGPIHDVVHKAFKAAKDDPTLMEDVEDVIAQGLNDLGFTLTPAQMKVLRIDESVFAAHRGSPSMAAAAVVAEIALGQKWRTVYDKKTEAKDLPSVPGPLGRWLPFPHVRKFVESLLAEEEKRVRAQRFLPLDALRSDDAEALVVHVSKLVVRKDRQALREDYPQLREQFREMVLALLRGEDPTQEWELTPELGDAWKRIREKAAETGEKLREANASAEVLEELATHVAEALIAEIATAFGMKAPKPA